MNRNSAGCVLPVRGGNSVALIDRDFRHQQSNSGECSVSEDKSEKSKKIRRHGYSPPPKEVTPPKEPPPPPPKKKRKSE
jgi:hypothetical protein